MLAPGETLQNRYHVRRQIGGGGMSLVYLAEDTRLPGRRCAIKEMSPRQLPPEDRNWAIANFRQEAQMLATLRHASLATVTDCFSERGNWYLVMDYIEGETLGAYLAERGGRLSMEETLHITRQLCDVLAYLHNQDPQVIFRDLKPGNVMLTPQGDVKLIDFGIARFFKPGKTGDTVNLGTPGYAAPEQYGKMGSQSGPRADVYSLGVLLLQMVSGYNPMMAQTPFPIPDPRSIMRTLPPYIAGVIAQATQVRPDLRYENIQAMHQALFPPTYPLPSQPEPAQGKSPQKAQRSSLKRFLGIVGGGLVGIGLLSICGAVAWLSGWLPWSPPSLRATATFIPPVSVSTSTPARSSTPLLVHSATPSSRPTATSMPSPTSPPTTTPKPEPTLTPTAMPDLAQRKSDLLKTLRYRHGNGPVIFANTTSHAPTLDGALTEWDEEAYPIPYKVHDPDNTWEGKQDLSGYFYIAWDTNYLYIGVDVTDDNHIQLGTGAMIYQGDEVEIQIDTALTADFYSEEHSDDDGQIGLSPGDFETKQPEAYIWLPEDLEGPGRNIDIAARDAADGYVLEAAIPWRYLGGRPTAETAIGFCLNLSDKDDADFEEQEVMLSTAPERKWRDPTTWGTLVLVDW